MLLFGLQIYFVLMTISYNDPPFLCLINILEVQLTADTEHAVGAGEGVADQRLCGGDALVVVVVGLEVSGLEAHDVRHLVVEAQAEAEAVDDKRRVICPPVEMVSFLVTSHSAPARYSLVPPSSSSCESLYHLAFLS